MRTRLAIAIAAGTLALAFAAQAIAAAPTLEAPGPDASYTSGDPIVFRAMTTNIATPPTEMAFYVSRDDVLDGGVLANRFDAVRGFPDSPGSTTFQGAPDADDGWPKKPGTYFWQAAEPGCAVPPCESEVRRFNIQPLAASSVSNPAEIETFLDRHPKHRTHKRKIKFKFSSNVQGARFRCLFATGWENCDSPHVFRRLQPGRYKFKVRAVVNKDLRDPTPVKWVFRVLRGRR